MTDDKTFLSEETVPYDDLIETVKASEHKAKNEKRKQFFRKINPIARIVIGVCAVIILWGGIDYAYAGFKHVEHPTFFDITETARNKGIKIGRNEAHPDDLTLIDCNRNGYIPIFRGFYTNYDVELKTPIGMIYLNQKAIYSRNLNEVISRETITDTEVSLSGTYEGTFSLSPASETVYSAYIEIDDDNTGTIQVTSENGKKGKYYIKVIDRDDLFFSLKGTSWITHPTFFMMTDFSCYYDCEKNSLMPDGNSEEIFTFIKNEE